MSTTYVQPKVCKANAFIVADGSETIESTMAIPMNIDASKILK